MELLKNTRLFGARVPINRDNNFLSQAWMTSASSRTSFSWGIPVDSSPGLIVYFWVDALPIYNAL
jgi:methionyl-tRNA synthetase